MRVTLATTMWTRLLHPKGQISPHFPTHAFGQSSLQNVRQHQNFIHTEFGNMIDNNQEIPNIKWHSSVAIAIHTVNPYSQCHFSPRIYGCRFSQPSTPLWRRTTTSFHLDNLPTKISLCIPSIIQQINAHIASRNQPGNLLIFTDGSVSK